MRSTEQAASSDARFGRILDQVDYRLVESESDREEIYRLRYNAYLREGAVLPNPQHRVTDRYDELPNSWIFGIYHDGELASSLRITMCSAAHPETPSMDVFPDLLRPLIDQGKVLVDPTRFVANAAIARRLPELPYLTVRLAYVACNYFNADLGLATVRAEHQAFYRRMFLHQPLTGPRDYPGLLKPICLMAVDFPKMWDTVAQRYPFLRSSLFERRMLFGSDRVLAPTLSGPDSPVEASHDVAGTIGGRI